MHFILLKYIHNIIRYMCFYKKTGSTCPALPYTKICILKYVYKIYNIQNMYTLSKYRRENK